MTATRRPARPSPRPQPREIDPEFTRLVETWLRESPAANEAEAGTEVGLAPAGTDAPDAARPERRDDAPSRVSIGLGGTLAFIFVFGALFGLAAFHSVLVQNQLRLDRLSRDVDREQTRYEALRIEYGQAAAPFRILAQASARGMLPSKSRQKLQVVLPEQGSLNSPSTHPFGAVSNFVPPVVTAPPPQTTAAANAPAAATAPAATTAPAAANAPAATTAPTTAPTSGPSSTTPPVTTAKAAASPTTKAGT